MIIEKKALKFLLVLLCFTTLPVEAKQFSMDNGGVVFNAPEGFEEIPEDIKEIKYPYSRAPKFVVGNESASATIAYDIKEHDISNKSIESLRNLYQKIFSRMMPITKWKKNKSVTISNQEWGYLEFKSRAIDTHIHNIMLFSKYKNKMIMFNFNATKKEYKKYKKAFRASIESIKIVEKDDER